jgi:hypothetical protein
VVVEEQEDVGSLLTRILSPGEGKESKLKHIIVNHLHSQIGKYRLDILRPQSKVSKESVDDRN